MEGIAASIGSVGDAYDNALAKSTIGLFKTEAVSKSSPFLQGPIKTIDEIEFLANGVGGLVQHPPPAQHLGLRHSRRVRGQLLLSTIALEPEMMFPGNSGGDSISVKGRVMTLS